jgi:hypothetical protein
MSPEERSEIGRALSNQWLFQAAFVGRLMLALRSSGALSAEAADQMLQDLDQDLEALDGEEDRAFATAVLASARSVLASHGYGPGRRPGAR